MDCDSKYAGETIQKLGERIKEHKSSCEKVSINNITALSKHAVDLTHKFDFDNVKTLCNENNKDKLRIQAVNHIVMMNEEKCCNFKTDSQHIIPSYYNLREGNIKHKSAK